MNSLFQKLSIIISSLWVGGLWAMLMVTTILFNKMPSSYIAGAIANDMFAFMNLFGIFSSSFLLIYGFRKENLSFDELDFLNRRMFFLSKLEILYQHFHNYY